MKMRVLIVCSSFPPVNATAIHRTVALVRELRQAGDEVLVVTKRPGPELPIDPALLEKVPEGVAVLWARKLQPVAALRRLISSGPAKSGSAAKAKVADADAQEPVGPAGAAKELSRLGMAKDWLSWWLQVPDTQMGWLAPAVWAGLRRSRTFRPDVIYSTAPMWTSHLIGMALAALLRRPWVADLRDPWRANPFRNFPYAAHDHLDAALERRMVRRACRIICNTEPVREEFTSRYSDCPARFVTIPNGYDALVVDRVRNSAKPPSASTLRLVHTGGFYGPRDPRPFFAALALLARHRPEARATVRFQQYGPSDYGVLPLAKLAAQAGADGLVEVMGNVSHVQALTAVAEAGVAVAAGQVGVGSELQVPRKFYEYLGLGRPILATGGTCVALEGLLGGHPEGVWLVEQAQEGPLCAALEEIYDLWRAGALKGPAVPAERFTEQRMAQKLRGVLNEACQA